MNLTLEIESFKSFKGETQHYYLMCIPKENMTFEFEGRNYQPDLLIQEDSDTVINTPQLDLYPTALKACGNQESEHFFDALKSVINTKYGNCIEVVATPVRLRTVTKTVPGPGGTNMYIVGSQAFPVQPVLLDVRFQFASPLEVPYQGETIVLDYEEELTFMVSPKA